MNPCLPENRTCTKNKKGDKVIAGSINGNGSIKVTVSHAAKDSYLLTISKAGS